MCAGCYQARCVELPVGMLPGARDDAECAICHCYLHLSAVECRCCPKRYVCLRHANNLCECPASSWRLAYRHSLGELSTILADLAACVPPGVPPPACLQSSVALCGCLREAASVLLSSGSIGCGYLDLNQWLCSDGSGAVQSSNQSPRRMCQTSMAIWRRQT